MVEAFELWLQERYEWAEEKTYYKDGNHDYHVGDHIYWAPGGKGLESMDPAYKCDENFSHTKIACESHIRNRLKQLEGDELEETKKGGK